MFCPECGKEVVGSGKYCVNCGYKIEGMTGIQNQTEANLVDSNRSTKSNTVRSYKEIENSEDINTTKQLFGIFKSLIAPVREIEQLEEEKKSLNSRFTYCQPEKTVTGNMIAKTIGYCALFFGIGFIIFIITILFGSFGAMIVLCLDLLLPIPLGIIVGYVLPKKANVEKEQQKANSLKEATERMPQLEAREKQLITMIAPYITFCPPSYRTSDALIYFVDSYVNSRVSTLKEAVREYDALNRHMAVMAHLESFEYRLFSIEQNTARMADEAERIADASERISRSL